MKGFWPVALVDGERAYIRPSQAVRYLECPAQFYFEHVEGLRFIPNAKMAVGSGVHAVAATNYRQKKESAVDLPVDELTDRFRDDWKERKREAVFQEGDDAETFLDTGVKMVESYHVGKYAIAPKTQPVEVEKRKEIWIPNYQLRFTWTPDLRDDQNMIRDLKCTWQTPGSASWYHRIQLAGYAYAESAATQELESGVGLDYVIGLKREVKTKTFRWPQVSKKMVRFYMILFANVVRDIREERFFPNPIGAGWKCSAENCQHWHRCHQRFDWESL